MNLGQTMITMGMFVLLVMSVISANRMLMQNTETGLQTEALTESATIANDLFQEAQSKKFDEFADSSGTQSQSDFSSPSGGSHSEWGPSTTEQAEVGSLPESSPTGQFHSILAYDDIDDYNGYSRVVGADTTNGIKIGGFLVTVRVSYVDPNHPDVAVNYQTFVKRIEVDVVHDQYLPKITYSSLMSY
jgi:hypothetical protein